MLHHPTIAAHQVKAQLQEVSQESFINGLVHGGLIAIIVLISFCLTHYAQYRDIRKPNILLGIICYWLGTIAMIQAALVSGFAVPHLASMINVFSTAELNSFIGLKKLTWATNQACSNMGCICWAITMCCWSFGKFAKGAVNTAFALLSFITGKVIITALIMGWLSLTVSGMTAVTFTMSSWHICIAWMLYTKH